MIVQFDMEIDAESLGSVQDVCPHCQQLQPLSRHRLRGNVQGIPAPASEVLVCPNCQLASRMERMASRVFGVLFLVPFALALAGAAAAGLYMLGAMALNDRLSFGFVVLALVLVAVAGGLCWRTVRAARRLLRPGLIPMQGVLTRL